MKIFTVRFTVALALIMTTAVEGAVTKGSISGHFTVDNRGNAAYAIPIALPTGRGGLTPGLTLSYLSRSGDGLVGKGWALRGMPKISRCRQTYAQDGDANGVSFDSFDRYCLDGQRLVQVNPGSHDYHSSGAEYRTEIDTFVKVVAQGSLGSGPRSFVVHMPDGITRVFGDTAGARRGSASDDILEWFIEESRDKFGNLVRYSYLHDIDADGSKQELWPSAITYADDGINPQYRIEFVYDDRPALERRSGFVSGLPWLLSKRMTAINVKVNDAVNSPDYSLIHAYNLSYESAGTGITYRSRLSAVEQCGPNSCLPPTVFSWQHGTVGWGPEVDLGLSVDSSIRSGDFDGDGITDILFYNNTQSRWDLRLGTGAGFGPATPTNITALPNRLTTLFVDSDNRLDLVGTLNNVVQVYQSNGTASFSITDTGIDIAGRLLSTVDLDGNGLGDVITVPSSGPLRVHYNQTNLGLSAPFGPEQVYDHFDLSGDSQAVAGGPGFFDYDGDGDAELIIKQNRQETGAYFNVFDLHHDPGSLNLIDLSPLQSFVKPIPADLNGDGLSDLLTHFAQPFMGMPAGNIGLLSDGTKTAPFDANLVSVGLPDYLTIPDGNVSFADLNRDGRSDLIYRDIAADDFKIHYSEGTAFAPSPSLVITSPSASQGNLGLTDIDSDGDGDLLYEKDGTLHLRLNTSDIPDVITRIVDGHGNWLEPEYVPLAGYTGYTMSSGLALSGDERQLADATPIVARYSANDGVGRDYTVTYNYIDAIRKLDGRGFAGFRSITTTESAKDIDSGQSYMNERIETLYSTEFPYQGRPIQSEKSVASGQVFERKVISLQQAATFPDSNYPSRSYNFVYVNNTATETFEVGGPNDGELVSVLNTSKTYNLDYGFVEESVTTASRGDAPWASSEIKTVVTPHNLSEAASWWCLGLPARVETTAKKYPWSEADQRTRTFSGYSSHCQPTVAESGENDPGSATDDESRLVTTVVLDSFGNIIDSREADAAGLEAERRSTFSYDEWGNRVAETRYKLTGEDDHVQTHTWDNRFGLSTGGTSVQGQLTFVTYDDFGRAKAETNPNAVDYLYWFADCPVSSPPQCQYSRAKAGTDGSYASADIDRFGRTIRTETKLNAAQTERSVVETAFDEQGRIRAISIPYLANTESPLYIENRYDALGRIRLRKVPVAEGSLTYDTSYTYRKWLTDEHRDSLQAKTYEYDANGQLWRLTEAGKTTTYSYNGFDQPASVTDSANNRTLINYDANGRRISIDDPDTGLTQFANNVWGQPRYVHKNFSPQPEITEFRYDQLGRRAQRLEAEGITDWSYFEGVNSGASQGLLAEVSMTDPGNGGGQQYRENHWYTPTGLLARTTTTVDGFSFMTDRAYDPLGRLSSMTYPITIDPFPFRLGVSYNYDTAGYLDTVVLDTDTGTVYDLESVDARGQETYARLQNEHREQVYDRATGQLKALRSGSELGVWDIQNLEYEWYPRGNFKSRQDLRQSGNPIETFFYDEGNPGQGRDRLTSVDLHDGNNLTTTLSLSYNGLGNIITKSDLSATGGNVIYSYGTGNAGPHAVTSISVDGSSDAHTFSYDNAGKVIARNGDTISWTSFDKPLMISRGNASSHFAYGPDRQRIRQIRSDGTVTYYAAPHFELDVDGDSTRSRMQVYAGSEVVYVLELQSFSVSPWARDYVSYRDHIGSVDTVTDGDGAVLERYSFDAFGRRRNSDWTAYSSDTDFENAELLDRGFTGHEHHDSLRLVNMNGRMLDPIIGRTLSADPLVVSATHSDALNRYSYVHNNPLTKVDPSGYAPVHYKSEGFGYAFSSRAAGAWSGLDQTRAAEAQRSPALMSSFFGSVSDFQNSSTGFGGAWSGLNDSRSDLFFNPKGTRGDAATATAYLQGEWTFADGAGLDGDGTGNPRSMISITTASWGYDFQSLIDSQINKRPFFAALYGDAGNSANHVGIQSDQQSEDGQNRENLRNLSGATSSIGALAGQGKHALENVARGVSPTSLGSYAYGKTVLLGPAGAALGVGFDVYRAKNDPDFSGSDLALNTTMTGIAFVHPVGTAISTAYFVGWPLATNYRDNVIPAVGIENAALLIAR